MAKTIKVRSIILEGPDGKHRGELSIHGNEAVLTLASGKGTGSVDVGMSDSKGPFIALSWKGGGIIRLGFDEHGNPAITMTKGTTSETFSIGQVKKGGA